MTKNVVFGALENVTISFLLFLLEEVLLVVKI